MLLKCNLIKSLNYLLLLLYQVDFCDVNCCYSVTVKKSLIPIITDDSGIYTKD